jgi:hypothetical protein
MGRSFPKQRGPWPRVQVVQVIADAAVDFPHQRYKGQLFAILVTVGHEDEQYQAKRTDETTHFQP